MDKHNNDNAENIYDTNINLTFQYWCVIGDYNGVVTSQMDRLADKGIKGTQGKLLPTFFELTDTLGLIDL